MMGQGPGLAEEVSVHRDWRQLAQEWGGGEVIEAAGDEASVAAHQGQNLVGSLNVIRYRQPLDQTRISVPQCCVLITFSSFHNVSFKNPRTNLGPRMIPEWPKRNLEGLMMRVTSKKTSRRPEEGSRWHPDDQDHTKMTPKSYEYYKFFLQLTFLNHINENDK